MRRRILLGVAVGAVIALGTAGGAFAGERAGNGHETPAGDKAKSLCAFSGLEDFDFMEDVQPGVVQNWGAIPKEFRDMASIHGAAVVMDEHGEGGCNAHMFPNK